MAISRLSETTLQNAFQKFNTLWDGRSAVGGIDSLGSFVCSATTTNVVFDNIPQTYTHLQLRCFYRSAWSAGGGLYIAPNLSVGGGGGNYFSGGLGAVTGGVTQVSSTYFTTTAAYATGVSSIPNSATANYFTTAIVDILDYSNTTKQKVMRTINGFNSLNNGGITISGMVRYGTSGSITALTIDDSGGGGWLTGTTFSLYGIK